MNNVVLLRDVLLAGEGLAISVLLPSFAWLVTLCFPKRAALRHLIWLSSFIGLLILPPIALLLPANIVIKPSAALDTQTGIPIIPHIVIPEPLIATSAPTVPFQTTTGKSTLIGIASIAGSVPRHLESDQLLTAAVALWLLGVAVILLYRAMALLGLSSLRRRSNPRSFADPELEGRWRLRVATQSGLYGPLTWGIFRPVILLPQNAENWPSERLMAVLRHEIAHVRRHDMLAQLLAQVACALYWPNPLVWLGARRMRREAEIAADDAVLCAGIKPSSYAETLMALAAEFRRPSPGLAMATPSTLEARVMSVLASSQSRLGVTAMDVFKTACIGTAATVFMALARPDLAVAQLAAPIIPIAAAAAAATPPVATPQGASTHLALQAVVPATHKAVATIVSAADPVFTQAGANKSQNVEPRSPTDQVIAQVDAETANTAKVQAVPTAVGVKPAPTAPVTVVAPWTRIQRIVLNGVQLEPSPVLTYLGLREGNVYDAAVANRAVQASGLFAPTTTTGFDQATGTLTINVTENPIVNQVVLLGNSVINDKDLIKEIGIKSNLDYGALTRDKMLKDVSRLVEIYRRNGKFIARIDPEIIVRSQNRIDLVFSITEGPSFGVARIDFVGNRVFSSDVLRSQILTEESAWWKLVSNNDNYDPDRLIYDRELLRHYYVNRGYADVKVVNAVAQLTPDGKNFNVTYTVDEGSQYKFGSVTINSQVPELAQVDLNPLLKINTGDVYDEDQVKHAADNLATAVKNAGLASAEIQPNVTRNRDNLTIDVSFKVGQQLHVTSSGSTSPAIIAR